MEKLHQRELIINPAAMSHNIAWIRRNLSDGRLIASVKADAYGHGLVQLAPYMREVDGFWVASLAAAKWLRANFPAHQVILSGEYACVETLELCAQMNIDFVVYNVDQLALLSQIHTDNKLNVWIKIDTGMHRLGVPLVRAADVIRQAMAHEMVDQVTLMTHFADADNPSSPLNMHQYQNIKHIADQFTGLEVSIGNSAGLLNFSKFASDYWRIGILLYGISPMCDTTGLQLGLRPVMTLRARVIHTTECLAGESIGYSSIWQAQIDTRMAIVSIGYADGYPRSVAQGAPVLVNGIRGSIAGTISMDLICVALPSGSENIKVGDWAILWGEGLPIETIAAHAGTISYELMVRVGMRVKKRIMVNNKSLENAAAV